MLERSRFELIKEKYGDCASWALWADPIKKPKENIGDLRLFGVENYDTLLTQLNPNIVLVGLNISRRVEHPLGNFHDGRPASMDYKIRVHAKRVHFMGSLYDGHNQGL